MANLAVGCQGHKKHDAEGGGVLVAPTKEKRFPL